MNMQTRSVIGQVILSIAETEHIGYTQCVYDTMGTGLFAPKTIRCWQRKFQLWNFRSFRSHQQIC